MKYALPIRNILKYSLVFTLAVSLISFLGSFMHEENLTLVWYRAANTFFMFASSCFINLFLIKCFEEKKSFLKTDKSLINRKLFATGHIITFILFSGLNLLNEHLACTGILPNAMMRDEIYNMGAWIYLFFFLISSMMYGMVYILHSFIIFEDWKTKVDLENSRLKSVHAETVNHLLKQQIQPHFLFNALNVLKSLIRKQPDAAEEYLLSLSDFLRASVNQNQKIVAPLKEELKICSDYMEMQRIRFGDAINFAIDIDDNDIHSRDYLPAFSLQPLVENAIKHNELTYASPLRIRIYKDKDVIVVENNLKPKSIMLDSTGNGLTNLAERYRIISGNTIQIEETNTQFIVRIKILESENTAKL
jgi:two-component system LytT family sensor kinase